MLPRIVASSGFGQCVGLRIQPSGLYARQKSPLSQRAQEDARRTELIRRAWNVSGKDAINRTAFQDRRPGTRDFLMLPDPRDSDHAGTLGSSHSIFRCVRTIRLTLAI
ncbi:hypothetical protein ASD39_19145 [Sphingomonas sp. Root50]|nr:hypothetical protein ASD17_15830 [Sphingomonas sp. Root1294]KQY72069.1 hypothetical protein ASD39_19145 [Sphingomonas sp. Root50]KRB94662.1 hypothetical protein ASE22_01610 [Sphingomonas sp. Root720]